MPTCPACQQSHSKRDGHTPSGRLRYAGRSYRCDFTVHSGSAFSGYRFPPEVILTALRWYFICALGAAGMELLADRGMDVSRRTILRWAQAFWSAAGAGGPASASPFRAAVVCG
jgi:transposase-like protein